MSIRQDDPALEALLMPFLTGRLEWPQAGALFLRARQGYGLVPSAWPGLVCEQSFKPEAQALERAGFPVQPQGDSRHPLVLVLPPRQRDEARALLAEAVARAEGEDAVVIASVPNNEGAKAIEGDLVRIAGPVNTVPKHKCRVFWVRPNAGGGDAELAAQWRKLDVPRPILGGSAMEGRFISRPGVFAWERIDPASALLAEHLPGTLAGRAADLGAGWGFLSDALLQRCPKITSLHLYEAEARALDLARDNMAPHAERAALDFRWHDVTAGLPDTYDVIISNPPFHGHGRAARPEIGRAFIAAAAQALAPGGSLWLVANRQLPYEQVLGERFSQIEVVAERGGFKVIRADKGRPARTER
ncbi:class I SAM-dependent methyltransferase [Luteimonas sp. A478]